MSHVSGLQKINFFGAYNLKARIKNQILLINLIRRQAGEEAGQKMSILAQAEAMKSLRTTGKKSLHGSPGQTTKGSSVALLAIWSASSLSRIPE